MKQPANVDYQTCLNNYLKQLRRKKALFLVQEVLKVGFGSLAIVGLFILSLFDSARQILQIDLISKYTYVTFSLIITIFAFVIFLYHSARKIVEKLAFIESKLEKLTKIIDEQKFEELQQNYRIFSLGQISLSIFEQIAVFNPIHLKFVECKNVKALNCSEVNLLYYSNIRPK